MSWDQRGHGDSTHAVLYSWSADVRDAVCGARLGDRRCRCPSSGHSKGGSLMLELADALPHRVEPPRQPRRAAVDPQHARRRRPRAHPDAPRRAARPGSITARRWPTSCAGRAPSTSWPNAGARMNTRLPIEWLRYLVTVGAERSRRRLALEARSGAALRWVRSVEPRVVDGAPSRHRGARSWACSALETEAMGWGTLPEDVEPYLPAGRPVRGARRRRPLRPHRAAASASPTSSWSSWRDGTSYRRRLTPRTDRAGPAPPALARRRAGRCCCCTGWASAPPRRFPATSRPGREPIVGLDFTGHGGSTIPVGGRLHRRDPDGRRRHGAAPPR